MSKQGIEDEGTSRILLHQREKQIIAETAETQADLSRQKGMCWCADVNLHILIA